MHIKNLLNDQIKIAGNLISVTQKIIDSAYFENSTPEVLKYGYLNQHPVRQVSGRRR